MAPQSPQMHHHHRHPHNHNPHQQPLLNSGHLPGQHQVAPVGMDGGDEVAARWNAAMVAGGANGMMGATAAAPNGGGGGQDKIKCVFLGDGAVGKTSLIVSYTTNGYPSEYVPTAIDTYDVVVNVDGEPVTFEMCDTPGQDDFDTLRPLVYPNTDVFLICFSVVSPSSFTNIREKWMPELKKSYGGSTKHIPPLVLVGTQSDLREDVTTLVQLAQTKEVPVSDAEAKKLSSQLGCENYIESSALTQKNLKEVFDEAIMAGLKGRRQKERKAAKRASREQRMAEGGGGCLGGQKCSIM